MSRFYLTYYVTLFSPRMYSYFKLRIFFYPGFDFFKYTEEAQRAKRLYEEVCSRSFCHSRL